MFSAQMSDNYYPIRPVKWLICNILVNIIKLLKLKHYIIILAEKENNILFVLFPQLTAIDFSSMMCSSHPGKFIFREVTTSDVFGHFGRSEMAVYLYPTSIK